MEWILLVQTRNVGLVTDIPTAEYLSAWQVLGNLEIAEVLRDYVASSPQLIRFARVSSHVVDFNARNKSLTAKLLQGAIGIINFERLSPNFIADTMNWFLNSVLD